MIAGLVLVASAVTAKGTDLRAGSRTDLESLIRAGERRGDASQAQVDRARAEVDALRAGTSQGEQALLDARPPPSRPRPGSPPITRPGASGSPSTTPRPGARATPDPAGSGPDDLVVHQQDVQAVVNALWRGGADGVQVMDQRLIATSAVRCVGQHADPARARLLPAVRDHARSATPTGSARRWPPSPTSQLFRDYVEIAGLGYDERRLADVTLPGGARAPRPDPRGRAPGERRPYGAARHGRGPHHPRRGRAAVLRLPAGVDQRHGERPRGRRAQPARGGVGAPDRQPSPGPSGQPPDRRRVAPATASRSCTSRASARTGPRPSSRASRSTTCAGTIGHYPAVAAPGRDRQLRGRRAPGHQR